MKSRTFEITFKSPIHLPTKFSIKSKTAIVAIKVATNHWLKVHGEMNPDVSISWREVTPPRPLPSVRDSNKAYTKGTHYNHNNVPSQHDDAIFVEIAGQRIKLSLEAK